MYTVCHELIFSKLLFFLENKLPKFLGSLRPWKFVEYWINYDFSKTVLQNWKKWNLQNCNSELWAIFGITIMVYIRLYIFRKLQKPTFLRNWNGLIRSFLVRGMMCFTAVVWAGVLLLNSENLVFELCSFRNEFW